MELDFSAECGVALQQAGQSVIRGILPRSVPPAPCRGLQAAELWLPCVCDGRGGDMTRRVAAARASVTRDA